MTEAIVLGGSRGIGRAISESLESIGIDVLAASRADIDTSDLDSVRRFTRDHPATDILVLNTGGPPPKPFAEVAEEEWNRYHNQLFLGFCIILQNIKIRDGGYIFLVSSGVVREPVPNLVISSAYRAAFVEVLKVLSKEYAAREINCVNIAPGLISTGQNQGHSQGHPRVSKVPPHGQDGKARRDWRVRKGNHPEQRKVPLRRHHNI